MQRHNLGKVIPVPLLSYNFKEIQPVTKYSDTRLQMHCTKYPDWLPHTYYNNSITQECKGVMDSDQYIRGLDLPTLKRIYMRLASKGGIYHQGTPPSGSSPLLAATIRLEGQKPEVPWHQLQEQPLYHEHQVFETTCTMLILPQYLTTFSTTMNLFSYCDLP